MRKRNLLSLALPTVLALLKVGGDAPGLAVSSANASAEQITRQALAEYKLGHVPVAVRLEKDATKQYPTSWVAHSTLSVLAWHVGDITTALKESKTAATLAPTNPVALYNVALFHQLLAMWQESAGEYQAAIKAAPDDLQARVGYVQCLVSQTRFTEAKKNLDEMMASDSNSFDWWNQTGQLLVSLKDYKKAEQAYTKALALASGEKDKRDVENSLFVAAVKAEDFARAESFQKQIIDAGSTNEYVYVESAASLARTPAQGEWLLTAALRNLGNKSESFFDISRQFSAKTDSPGVTAADRDAWLALATKAIDQAMSISSSPEYMWQKAAILDRQGNVREMSALIEQISATFKDNRLARYFQATAFKSNKDVALALKSALRPDFANANGSTSGAAYHLNICEGKFMVSKVSCACHLPMLGKLVSAAPGVFFAHVDKNVGKQPTGAVCFDASSTTLAELLRTVTVKMKDEFSPVSVTPISSVSKVVSLMLAHETAGNNRSNFVNSQGGEPRMPNLVANSQ